jgi:hypothetical protein
MDGLSLLDLVCEPANIIAKPTIAVRDFRRAFR